MTSPSREPSLDPRTPFTIADVVAGGHDPRSLRTTRWHRVFRGVYVSADVSLTLRVRTQAALLLHQAAAHASHTTAASLYGIVVPDDPDIHVTVKHQSHRRFRPGLRPHVREAGSGRRVVHGIPVSSPLQLFVELAGALPLVEAVVAGDAMIRLGLVTMQELREYCDRARGRHSRTSRRVVAYVREGVDSPMETRLRMLIILAGLPEPEVNFKVRDEFGAVLRRLDLSYPVLKMMIEYDGRHHVERVNQWESDLERRDEFESDGWRTLIVTSAGIYGNPEGTLLRIRKALRAKGQRVGRLSDAWRAHFPPR
ncbi:MAG: hypothetical protein M3Y66_06595 [Actinomycetota bacterium]|nr:hypothetical protein [Actinomycetota bacterium]